MNNWNDFTRDNYRRLLRLAASRYKIAPVCEWSNAGVTAIWRHDIDISPQSALATARIEHDEGIRATYYLNLRSDFYNLFEPAVVKVISGIRELGHELGVHMDASQVDTSSDARMEDALAKECSMIRAVYGIESTSFSFHNPSENTAGFKSGTYSGLINAYGRDLMAKFSYCSDSNGYWRFTPLEQFLQLGHAHVYVLTHPDWWQDEAMSPRDRVVRAIDGRAAATLRDYDSLLEKSGRMNLRT